MTLEADGSGGGGGAEVCPVGETDSDRTPAVL